MNIKSTKDMKKHLLSILAILCVLGVHAQTARQFTLLLSDRQLTSITPHSNNDGGIGVAMPTFVGDMPQTSALSRTSRKAS